MSQEVSFCFYFLEIVENWCYFFLKCFIEFTRETIWIWSFLYESLLLTGSIFKTNIVSFILLISLCEFWQVMSFKKLVISLSYRICGYNVVYSMYFLLFFQCSCDSGDESSLISDIDNQYLLSFFLDYPGQRFSNFIDGFQIAI